MAQITRILVSMCEFKSKEIISVSPQKISVAKCLLSPSRCELQKSFLPSFFLCPDFSGASAVWTNRKLAVPIQSSYRISITSVSSLPASSFIVPDPEQGPGGRTRAKKSFSLGFTWNQTAYVTVSLVKTLSSLLPIFPIYRRADRLFSSIKNLSLMCHLQMNSVLFLKCTLLLNLIPKTHPVVCGW